MKCAFLLGSARISGGTNVIFEHALRMQRRGIDVSIITEKSVPGGDLEWHPEARALSFLTYAKARSMQFDAAIATWWPTAYLLPMVRAATYGYFVQSIESRFYDRADAQNISFAETTYDLPVFAVTEATWIQQYLKARHGLHAELVRNGIRKDLFAPDGDRYAERQVGRIRVLVEGSLDARFKNVRRTIELCRRSSADEVWLLTPTAVERYEGVDRVFSQVPMVATPKVYRSCDVLVKLSYVEGMFGPPLEMFHCGGTAIVYDVTGHDEYIRHGVNAMVCRTDDEADVIRCINRLREDSGALRRLIAGAARTAADWPDWESASLAFEQAVADACRRQAFALEAILAKAPLFFDWFAFHEAQLHEAIDAQARMIDDRWAVMQKMESMIRERDQIIASQPGFRGVRRRLLALVKGAARRVRPVWSRE